MRLSEKFSRADLFLAGESHGRELVIFLRQSCLCEGIIDCLLFDERAEIVIRDKVVVFKDIGGRASVSFLFAAFNITDGFIGRAQDCYPPRTDSKDNVGAADRCTFYFARRNFNRVFFHVVDNAVVAVAVGIEEDIRAGAALQRIISLAAVNANVGACGGIGLLAARVDVGNFFIRAARDGDFTFAGCEDKSLPLVVTCAVPDAMLIKSSSA